VEFHPLKNHFTVMGWDTVFLEKVGIINMTMVVSTPFILMVGMGFGEAIPFRFYKRM
jgi:hypothetical protein